MAHSTTVYLITAEAHFSEPQAGPEHIKSIMSKKGDAVKIIHFSTYVQFVRNFSHAKWTLLGKYINEFIVITFSEYLHIYCMM